MDIKSILERIEKDGIDFIRFEQTDVYGNSRSKTIPAQHFEEKATKGLEFFLGVLAFDPRGGFIEDTTYTDDVGFCDATCFPDLQTFQVVPWMKRTARILIEPTFKGKPVEAHPRIVARRQLARLSKMGISLLSACEFKFYLVDKATRARTNDGYNDTWSICRFAACQEILHTFMTTAGVDFECAQTVFGGGQAKITFKPAFGIKATDLAFMFKTGVRAMALKNGYIASFMSKPYPDKIGNGCHFNHSLWDAEGKTSVLYDADSPTGLTTTGEHWVAGLIAHAPAITLLNAPTINCLKMFFNFCLHPMIATWGLDSRTCAFRVKTNGQDGTYIESRLGVSGCNPYIALAATVAAGTDGISRQLPLPPAVKGYVWHLDSQGVPPGTASLPNTMEDAMKALQEDEVIVNALGQEFIQCFLAHKRHELKVQSEAKNEQWEYDMFFDYM